MHILLFGLRRKQGKSRIHMAELLGVHAETYARKERGEIDITLNEAKLISDELESTINEVFPEYFQDK